MGCYQSKVSANKDDANDSNDIHVEKAIKEENEYYVHPHSDPWIEIEDGPMYSSVERALFGNQGHEKNEQWPAVQKVSILC